MSAVPDTIAPTGVAAGDHPAANARVIAAAGLALGAGAAWLAASIGWRQGGLLLLGGLLGVTLYHAAFGFTAHWRAFIADRRGAGLRAQMLMLAVAVVLFFPALAQGSLFGRPVGGFVAPVGISLLVGAFLFGLGMQLANGCGSGTLYTLGGGSTRMAVTLAGFVLGSLIATHHLHWWFALPTLRPVSAVGEFGLWPALALHLAVFAAVAAGVTALERRRHGAVGAAPAAAGFRLRAVWQGPWPLVGGAVGLAVLNYATLALAGHPWGITSAFALWGAKAAATAGLDVASWPYWAARAGALEASVFRDTVSLMNFGIVLGALLAAGAAGRFAPAWRVPWRSLAAAAVGGLLLGYGARLAFGCNIGAFFGGVVSGSPHGWVWLLLAFIGSAAGVRLRPWFGLPVERSARAGC